MLQLNEQYLSLQNAALPVNQRGKGKEGRNYRLERKPGSEHRSPGPWRPEHRESCLSNKFSGINVQILTEDVSFGLTKLGNTLVYADTSELFHGASCSFL